MILAQPGPRRRIYLMRHGEVSYVDRDGPVPDADAVVLTERGREQAAITGRALRDASIDRVVTSGFPRTVDTAALVLAERSGPVPEIETWPELAELHAGSPGNVPADEIEASLLAPFRGAVGRDASYLRGETVGALADRVLPAIDRLLSDASWDTVLLVLHGAVNRVILSRALIGEGIFLGQLEQTPACVNVLDVEDDPEIRGPRWYVRAVNVTPYDVVPAGSRMTSVEGIAERYRALRPVTS